MMDTESTFHHRLCSQQAFNTSLSLSGGGDGFTFSLHNMNNQLNDTDTSQTTDCGNNGVNLGSGGMTNTLSVKFYTLPRKTY
eukprot:UN27799